MDNLSYKYYYVDDADNVQEYDPANPPTTGVKYFTNKLARVKDDVPAGNYSIDIDEQAVGNYGYDKIGNLVRDNAEGLANVSWNVYGKIKSIAKNKNGVSTTMTYQYDAGGNRVMKQVGNKVTFYIRDAQGNVMGLYDATRDPAAGTQAGYTWQEQHLYGSSRLGMFTPRDYIANGQVGTAPPSTADPAGKRIYELSNHLGNVHVTISDILRQEAEDGKFVPEIVSTSDYYPFGMLMPERHGFKYGEGWAGGTDDVNGNSVPQKLSVHERSTNTVTEYKASKEIEFLPGFGDETLLSDEFVAYIADETNTTASNPKGSGGENNGYRYGFNGKENDNEVKGEGNQQDYGMRISDPRIGRFLSVDPLFKSYPFYSPYHFAGSNPIRNKDLDGGEPLDYTKNWQAKSLFVLNTQQKVGSYMIVNDTKLGVVDVELIHDKLTDQTWFIHRDNRGNHYFLNNSNGNHTEMSIDPKSNTVRGGAFELFATQDAIQAKLGGQLAEGMGKAMFGMFFVGAAIPAAVATGGSLFAVNNLSSSVGLTKAIVGGSADFAAQRTINDDRPINWTSVGASAVFGNPWVSGAVGGSYAPNDKGRYELQPVQSIATGSLIGGITGSATNRIGFGFPNRKKMSGMQMSLRGATNFIPAYWGSAVGVATSDAALESFSKEQNISSSSNTNSNNNE